MADIRNGHGRVGDGLSTAEEIIDKDTVVEEIGGHEVTVVTGRVLLHALAPDGRGLCGQDSDQLVPNGQAWDTGYLPHIPRCDTCVTGARSDAPAPGPGATGMDIRLAHDSAEEAAAAALLRDVLAEHDLRRWMFTDLVTVDADLRGGHSHPLTISAKMLLRDPGSTLAVFLHEQLHWIEGPGVNDAIAEARTRWPDPPPSPAGCHDAESTWGHLVVCALEYQALSDVLGPAAATDVLAQHKHYTWVYEQILGEPGWFAGLLDRHGVHVPEQPPVPRRYFGGDWWTALPPSTAEG